MKNVKTIYSDVIFFIVVFIAFYLLDRLSPFIADDYAYRFFYDESIEGLKIVDSLRMLSFFRLMII